MVVVVVVVVEDLMAVRTGTERTEKRAVLASGMD